VTGGGNGTQLRARTRGETRAMLPVLSVFESSARNMDLGRKVSDIERLITESEKAPTLFNNV
jgi:hypothetical protein